MLKDLIANSTCQRHVPTILKFLICDIAYWDKTAVISGK